MQQYTTLEIPIQKTQVEKGVSALFQVMQKKKKKNILFPDVAEKVCMQVAAVRIPPPHNHKLNILLKHSLHTDITEICVFVRDLPKKRSRKDYEQTIRYYEDFLKRNGVTNISKVIPVKQLKVEYMTFEARRKLCNQFDLFLADACIIKFLPRFLGKEFFIKKKHPRKVNFGAEDLKKEFEKVLLKTQLPMSHNGGCSMVQVGHSKMPESDIVENIMMTAQALERKYLGGFHNIRSLHIKLERSLSIPIYVNTVPVNKVHFRLKKMKKRTPVTGELSTLNSGYIVVTPQGDVEVKDWKPDREEEIWIRRDAEIKLNKLRRERRRQGKEGGRKYKGISSKNIGKQTAKEKIANVIEEAKADAVSFSDKDVDAAGKKGKRKRKGISSEDTEKQTAEEKIAIMSEEAEMDAVSSSAGKETSEAKKKEKKGKKKEKIDAAD